MQLDLLIKHQKAAGLSNNTETVTETEFLFTNSAMASTRNVFLPNRIHKTCKNSSSHVCLSLKLLIDLSFLNCSKLTKSCLFFTPLVLNFQRHSQSNTLFLLLDGADRWVHYSYLFVSVWAKLLKHNSLVSVLKETHSVPRNQVGLGPNRAVLVSVGSECPDVRVRADTCFLLFFS